MKIAAVIFDRDGVLNIDHGYVGHIERLEWTPGAIAAIAALNAAGIAVIVATNQSGVERGFFTAADVEALHGAMQDDLAAAGARIDAFYVCPSSDDAHPDRKPNPGMILRALADFALAPQDVILIGDKPSDLEAARRAGVAGALFEGGDLGVFLGCLGLSTRV